MVRIKEGETRKYIVPLRKDWLKVPRWRRSKRAITALRKFIIRHTKIENIKLSKWVNEEIWKRGGKNPPHKIEVNAKVEKEKIQDKKTKKEVEVPFVQVELATLPKRAERIKKKQEKKVEKFKKVGKIKEEKVEKSKVSKEKPESLKEKVAKKIKKKEEPKEKKSVKELAKELREAKENKAQKITKAQEIKMKK